MTGPSLFQVQIARRERLADDIIGLTLTSSDNTPLPAFEAGAHIDLHLPCGLIRQYSLCSDPADTHHYQLGILLDPNSRGGSLSVHNDLHEGYPLQISAPRNLFPLREASHSILLAGGIGVTPMMSMASTLARQNASFEFHYCARNRARAAFLPELEQSPWSDRVHLHLDDDEHSALLDLPAVLAEPQQNGSAKRVFICGPAGFIQFVRESAAEAGWHNDQIHFEQFSAPDSHGTKTENGSTELTDTTPDTTAADFEIVVASSGQVIPVAAGQSAANAMRAAGLDVSVSCEQGICGSCLTPVLDGTPEHNDYFQTDAEKSSNRQFTPCCSRAKSHRLVLDI